MEDTINNFIVHNKKIDLCFLYEKLEELTMDKKMELGDFIESCFLKLFEKLVNQSNGLLSSSTFRFLKETPILPHKDLNPIVFKMLIDMHVQKIKISYKFYFRKIKQSKRTTEILLTEFQDTENDNRYGMLIFYLERSFWPKIERIWDWKQIEFHDNYEYKKLIK